MLAITARMLCQLLVRAQVGACLLYTSDAADE